MTIKDQDLSEIHALSAEEQQQLIAKIEKLAGHIQMVLPDTLDEAWQEVVRLEEQAVVNTAKRGFLYMSIKTQCAHGEFESKLKEFGIAARTAQDAVSIAKMFLALPDAKTRTSALLNISKSKLVELARLPVETVEALDEDDLDSLNELSVREFRKEIKKLKDKNQELSEGNASLINELENERLRKAPDQLYGIPTLCAHVRRETFAHSSVVNESLEQNIAEVEALLQQRDLDLDARIGAGQSVYHLWLGVQQRINKMLQSVVNEFGEEHFIGAESLPVYSEDEWQDAQANREFMLSQFAARKGGQ
ncbi:hypothetical protein [Pseudoalteromonas sp. BDTF-M6]|uniref:hypothetical protein n=1 Tax=Pseudoalteromonas sp. BDTF-M6 TaxID=2796132 RepID=UPI001BB036DD|nr:hypothetical protein [Pseudoalteromonas sp. BDTF-M6]MBS3796691.1 hypothetical protein [Pseudoalteromonas sp. BDTF-M6]